MSDSKEQVLSEGLAAWLPSPEREPLFGLDRNVTPERMRRKFAPRCAFFAAMLGEIISVLTRLERYLG